MDTEQFSLCWNNFHNNLSSGFQDLLKDEDLVDVTLAVEGRYVKAHKTVLSVCSPYFKELFRVNPCKHPIVILQDVNYNALTALLKFMYQGEVSVGQDEIPAFMRVAEILKVKGLTDNANLNSNTDASSTNGLSKSGHSDHDQQVGVADRQPIMKRTRPVKKPMQHLKTPEYPGAPQSPLTLPMASRSPPIKLPAKQPRLDDMAPSQHYMEPTITPKQEPVDHMEDEYREPPTYEEKVNTASSMLDNSMGESSDVNFGLGKLTPANDISIPGGPLYLKSRKGHPVLIHNGHMYTLSHKLDTRSAWVCVKQRTLNCRGCVETCNGLVMVSYSGHNHTQLHDVIQRLQASSCSPSPELV